MSDPVAILEQLDADEIAARLQHLAGEREALLVLLRAARARDRRCRDAATPEADVEGQE